MDGEMRRYARGLGGWVVGGGGNRGIPHTTHMYKSRWCGMVPLNAWCLLTWNHSLNMKTYSPLFRLILQLASHTFMCSALNPVKCRLTFGVITHTQMSEKAAQQLTTKHKMKSRLSGCYIYVCVCVCMWIVRDVPWGEGVGRGWV